MLLRARIVGVLIIGTIIISGAMIGLAITSRGAASNNADAYQAQVRTESLFRTRLGSRVDLPPVPQVVEPEQRAVVPGVSAAGPLPPTPTLTPTAVPPTPTAVPPTPRAQFVDELEAATPQVMSQPETGDPYAACLNHPDRYNWQAYASAYDWPMDEAATVVAHESSGDLCAINASSGATCWFQIHPGGSGYLDPEACVAAAYAKWRASGGSFANDWYRYW